MSKSFTLLFVTAASLAAQPIGVGLKVGVPLNDAFELRASNTVLNSLRHQRYIIGPQFELRLPAGFSIELDALYNRFEIGSVGGIAGSLLGTVTDANSWEFPLMLKKKFGGPDVVAASAKPFVTAGASFRRLSGLSNIGSFITGNSDSANKTATGFVIGGGVEIRALFIRISPEIRFTRWETDNLRQGLANVLEMNRNQAQALVGISF